jgi:hypothetical protein
MTNSIKTTNRDNVLHIEVEGDFVLATCEAVRLQLLKSLQRPGPECLSLSEVTGIDVAAIQLAIAWKRSLANQQRIATIVLPKQDDIKELLIKTGITQIV